MPLGAVLLVGRVVTPDAVLDGGCIAVCGEDIAGVYASLADARAAMHPKPWAVEDLGRQYILPGFVDIHNHGLGGCAEVLDHWQHPRFTLSRLLRAGTLSVLASVIFSRKHREGVTKTTKAIESVVQLPPQASLASVDASPSGGAFLTATGAVVEGIHAEGPIVADLGGLPEPDADPSLEQFAALCSTMPSLRVMTISPAAEERVKYVRLKHLASLGVRVALGHDRVTSERAVLGALRVLSQCADTEAGGTPDHVPHLTHVYNVMAFHHRQPGLVNFALCPRLPATERYGGCTVGAPTAEVIGDLIHVHPLPLATLLAVRNRCHDIAMVSDCIAQYDTQSIGKRLRYNGREMAVRAEGGCYLTDPLGRPTSTLAGSTSMLSDQLYALLHYYRCSLVEACRMLATTPARVARIGHRVGSICAGRKANVLVVCPDVREIRRRMVYGVWADDETIGPYRILKPALAPLGSSRL